MLSRNTLKAIAFLTMLIDHIGMIFFPGQAGWRIVGRLSFPLFAYLLADGLCRTKNMRKMIRRLFRFALISQIPFSIAVYGHFTIRHLNIFVTLFAGASLCESLQNKKRLPAVLLICLLPMDYGIYGVLLILGFFVFVRSDCFHRQTIPMQKWQLCLLLYLLSVLYFFQTGSIMQFFTVAAALLLPCSSKKKRPWSKWAYAIYPVHFLVLWALAGFV